MRPLRLLFVLLALAMVVPASASAAVSVSVPPDPVAGTPLTFVASSDEPEARIYATLRPHDAAPCASGFDGEPDDRWLFVGDASGDVETKTIETTGTWLICAYSYSGGRGRPPTSTLAIVFSVRAGRAHLALDLPARSIGAGPFAFIVHGSSEVRAIASVDVYKGLDVRCERPAGDLSVGGTRLDSPGRTTGPFRIEGSHGFVLGLPFGTLTVCAWLKDDHDRVIAQATGTIRIQRAYPVLGQVELSRQRFEAAPAGGARTESVLFGTALNFRMNTSGIVTFRVRRRTGYGWSRVPGSWRIAVDSGVTYTYFSGRLGGRTLPRGRYQLLARAHNESGRSETRRISFRVIRRQRPGPGFD